MRSLTIKTLLISGLLVISQVSLPMIPASYGKKITAHPKHKIIKTNDHLGRIPAETWRDSSVPQRAILLCIHGMGLNSLSYEAFAREIAQYGIATYAIDVRGFGKYLDPTGMGQVDFQQSLLDIQEALKDINNDEPNMPIIILGESMGGAMALQAAAIYPTLVDGLITSVPSHKRYKEKRMAAKVVASALHGPNKVVDIGKSMVKQATQDEDLQIAWAEDSTKRTLLTPKELLSFQKFMSQNPTMAKRITTTPVLMLVGVQDQLVKQGGNVDLFNAISSKDKNLLMIGNSEHLMFEEGQFNDDVVDSVVNWIKKHCPQRSKALES